MNRPTSGDRFGKLTLMKYVGHRRRQAFWICACECGQQKEIRLDHLLSGSTRSCGCIAFAMRLTHGAAVGGRRTREYRAWLGAKNRCSQKSYQRYYGRGIKVCERWLESFETFLGDMGKCPQGMTLDRINNDGDYEPKNCRWATLKQQQRNTSRNRKLIHNGIEMTVTEWADFLGVKSNTITCRLRRGLPAEKALAF